MAHGGRNDEAAEAVAAEFPAVRSVVAQGDVTGANLGSHEVLREQSTWRAGAPAGPVTRNDTVGHMSGIRVAPGLKGRAAFAGGVEHANPAARLPADFPGDQDGNAPSKRTAAAMADAGMGVLFTVPNAGRQGAIEVCRERRIPQIGNVRDRVAAVPDVSIASAVADSGLAVFVAVEGLTRDRLRLGAVHTAWSGRKRSGSSSPPRWQAMSGTGSRARPRTWARGGSRADGAVRRGPRPRRESRPAPQESPWHP